MLPSPPGPEHLHPIAAATRDLRRVRRCERIAGSSGTLTLAAGLLGLPFTLGSGIGMALCITLIVLGWREMALRSGLRELDPLVCGRLARNQIALGVALTAYAGVHLFRGPGTIAALNSGELAQMPELAAAAEGVARLAHYGVYAGLILGAIVVQGAQSLYYAGVGRALRRAHARHPVWVLRVHRAAWSGTVDIRPATAQDLAEPPVRHAA
jgi:hypothetical protein